jgi:hypothetical protein
MEKVKDVLIICGLIALAPLWMVLSVIAAVKIGNDGDCQEPEFLALSEREKERA